MAACAVGQQCYWCCHWTEQPLTYVRIEHPLPSLDGRRVTCAWLCWRCLDKHILKPLPKVKLERTDKRRTKLRRQVSSRACRRWYVRHPKFDGSLGWRLTQMLFGRN